MKRDLKDSESRVSSYDRSESRRIEGIEGRVENARGKFLFSDSQSSQIIYMLDPVLTTKTENRRYRTNLSVNVRADWANEEHRTCLWVKGGHEKGES